MAPPFLLIQKTTKFMFPNIFTIFASNSSKNISFDSLTFTMPAYTEERMQNVIAAVENGCSLHQASEQYKIPRSTLRNRLRGASSKEEVNHDRQKLSVTEKTSLANQARIQYAFGLPLTHRQLRLAAQRMLAISASNASLGKH